MATTKQSDAIRAKRIAAEAKVAELRKKEAAILRGEKERSKKNREKAAAIIGAELLRLMKENVSVRVTLVSLKGIVEKMPKATQEWLVKTELWAEIFETQNVQSIEGVVPEKATPTPTQVAPSVFEEPLFQTATPTCPACGRGMQRRTRRDGGGEFWGCTGYPECKRVVSI